MRFKHSGRHFSSEDITFLIEQTSSKSRLKDTAESVRIMIQQTSHKDEPEDESDDVTGQFGTGFLTTHLLSEIVDLQGVVKDDGLPYRQFHVTLDRSGSDLEEVIASVQITLEQLKAIEGFEDYKDYKDGQLNTTFIYQLNQDGIDTAITGIEDLKACLPFTLAFLSSISNVLVKHENRAFRVLGKQPLTHNVDEYKSSMIEIEEKIDQEFYTLKLIKIGGSTCAISLPVFLENGTIHLAAMKSHKTPRLFCSFPLIGTEDFGIPFVINSPRFQINEERDGIILTDKDTEAAKINKVIVEAAVSYYLELIDHAATQGWKNLYQLADLSVPSQRKWLSIDWYKDNILKPIQNKIYTAPLVEMEDGSRIPLKQGKVAANIPFDTRVEIREGIWDLVHGVDYFKPPAKRDIHFWYKIFKNKIWDKAHHLDISNLTKHIIQKGTTLTELGQNFDIHEPIEWLNQYFGLLQLAEEKPLEFLNDGDYKLLPNQRGEFCLPNTLQNDGGIEDALKDIGDHLGKDYYGKLAHNSIEIKSLLRTKNQESVISEINQGLQSEKIELEQRKLACYALTRLFPAEEFEGIERRNIIYDTSVKLFSTEISSKLIISSWSTEIWSVSDRMQAEFIAHKVSAFQQLHKLSTHLKEDTNNTLKWLSVLASLFNKMKWNDLLGDALPILPNQNGTFHDLSVLSVEGEPIDETLKDIAASLRIDVREDLIDNTFDVPIPEKRKIFQKDIGSKIQDLVSKRLSELERTDETQKIFNQLFLWMYDNQNIAEDIFGYLYQNRHRLRSDAEVANSLRKVDELESENQSLKSQNEQLQQELEELKARLSAGTSGGKNTREDLTEQKQEIDDDFLIAHGVYSREKLEQILADPKIARRYSYSDPSGHFE